MPLACSCFRNIAGLSTRFLWQRGWPRRLISEEHREDVPARAQAFIDESLGYLSQAWYLCFYPLLFGLIGASLNFRAVDPAIAGKAVTYAVLAVTVRIFTATGARVGGRGGGRASRGVAGTMLALTLPLVTATAINFRQFTIRERLFMGLAWISKATTQAAFATVPLEHMQDWCTKAGWDAVLNPDPTIRYKGHSCAQLVAWGNAIKCVASAWAGACADATLSQVVLRPQHLCWHAARDRVHDQRRTLPY